MLSGLHFDIQSFLAWGGARIINEIQFDRGIGGYLKQAADANTVELAKERLITAVEEAKRRGYTSGFTSILYTTPDEDVGFWFNNLSVSLKELNEVRPDASLLERSNVLLKLRQTLLDHTQSGEKITAPGGITIFPSNGLFLLWALLSIVLGVVFCVVAVATPD